MSFYKNKSVLVTGGTGMIGQALCRLLIKADANVKVASLDSADRTPPGTKFQKIDLRSFENCQEVVSGYELVFHLAGIKGSPKMTAERPASFFVPLI